MKVYYRFSDGGYNKLKPDYVTKKSCLINFLRHFAIEDTQIHLIADKVSLDTTKWLENEIESKYDISIEYTNYGYGSLSFIHTLDMAKQLPDYTQIYFVEDDYIHREGSYKCLREGLDISDYVTLYDHPDKYLTRENRGNPLVKNGGEDSKVLKTRSTHWKTTNSTPMTFATKSEVIKKDYETIIKHCQNYMTDSYRMFLELGQQGRRLVSSIPARSTHGELEWLSPLVDWRKEIES